MLLRIAVVWHVANSLQFSEEFVNLLLCVIEMGRNPHPSVSDSNNDLFLQEMLRDQLRVNASEAFATFSEEVFES